MIETLSETAAPFGSQPVVANPSQEVLATAGLEKLSEPVRNYLSEAISKLGASNRVEAARLARTKGWL